MSSLARRAAAFLCLMAMLAGCDRTPASAQDPQSAADAFFAALERGDGRTAYDSSAFGFQATQSYEAFFSNAQQLGLVGAQPPAWTDRDISATEARLDGTVVTQSGQTIGITVTMTPDGRAWKLFSLRTATGQRDGESENRFTLVGKGAAFNDVYHQPMPNPRQLADLVHGTISTLNAAILTGSFHSFYLSVSKQWRFGQRTSGQLVAGVTERMLKEHFQGFADHKIDLSVLAGIPPVFDRTPLIDQDGLLDLHGYFDAPEFRATFSLQYAYELPRWRLFGIDLALRKSP